MAAKIVSLEEANALVPRLSALVSRQIERGTEIEDRLHRLHRAGVLQDDEGSGARSVHLAIRPEDWEDVRVIKRELATLMPAYEAGWTEVQELGAVVKDPRVGIVDFYGHVDGKLVCLCWRFGEEAIGYYHAIDAGFAGRRPLEPGVRDRTLN